MEEATQDIRAPTVLAAWRAMLAEFGNRRPRVPGTGAGGDFSGVFGTALHAEGIIHIQKGPRHRDALAVVELALLGSSMPWVKRWRRLALSTG